MYELKQINNLLDRADAIYRHQMEIKILKGENFNIFSILKMETRENDTHSAFLGELLNPKGSHMFKEAFLQYFLETVDYKGPLNVSIANVILEHHVGFTNKELMTGGRLDIFIYDSDGNSICIENKINAGDQSGQIQRYSNHNANKNTVYYLTKYGEDASPESKGHLKEETDYHCISYKTTIVEWLEKCLKESVEQPILRESVKQYIILIKKITNQLTDHKMEKEIKDLILKNYKAANLIVGTIEKVELEASYEFLLKIKDGVERELGNEYTVTVSDDLSKAYAGLQIKHPTWKGPSVSLEGQSRMPWQQSIFGIVAPKEKYDRKKLKELLSNIPILNGARESQAWPFYKFILFFDNPEERTKLFDPVQKMELVKKVTDALTELCRACEEPLSKIERYQS